MSKKIEVTTETITPKIAESWLNGNTHNRDLRDRHVDFLANEMKHEHWQLNGDTIKFSEDGQLIDGQHRLFAVIESGVTIKSLVARNVSKEAFDTIDIGLKRTAGDTLTVAGEEHGPTLATAVALVKKFGDGNMSSHEKLTNTEVREALAGNPDVREALEAVRKVKIRHLMPLGSAAALYCLFARKDPTGASAWLAGLSTGIGLTKTDPIYMLREQLIKNAAKGNSKIKRDHILAISIKAWNMTRDKRSTRQLVWKAQEEFPQVIK